MSQRLLTGHAVLAGSVGGIGLAVAEGCLNEGANCIIVAIGARPTKGAQDLIANFPEKA